MEKKKKQIFIVAVLCEGTLFAYSVVVRAPAAVAVRRSHGGHLYRELRSAAGTRGTVRAVAYVVGAGGGKEREREWE